MKKLSILFSVLVFILTGCTMPGTSSPTETAFPTLTEVAIVNPTAAATVTLPPTPEPTATWTPEPTVTETIEPSPTRFVPFTASVWANGVNLRTNPGYLFPSLRQLEEGAEITVLGMAPGGEWLFVRRPDSLEGWVFTILVESDRDLSKLPIIEPTEVQTVTGRLLMENGEPINGVQFSITKGVAVNAPRNDATTDQDGVFIAFMPLDASGEWTVTYVAISCTSIVHDAYCNTKPEYAGTVNPASQTMNLPFTGQLEFVWK